RRRGLTDPTSSIHCAAGCGYAVPNPARGGCAAMADKYVYDFEEGNKDMKYLLGGKGANLAEMTNMGLPVPHGFTVTCEACNAYRAAGRQFPSGMLDEAADPLAQLEQGTPPGRAGRQFRSGVLDGGADPLAQLEQAMGRRMGDPGHPLLVSVRSRAAFS